MIIKGETVEFNLEPLSVLSETLYIVNCTYKAHAYCFHLIYDMEEGHFLIMDRHKCSHEILSNERRLTTAIEQYHLDHHLHEQLE